MAFHEAFIRACAIGRVGPDIGAGIAAIGQPLSQAGTSVGTGAGRSRKSQAWPEPLEIHRTGDVWDFRYQRI